MLGSGTCMVSWGRTQADRRPGDTNRMVRSYEANVHPRSRTEPAGRLRQDYGRGAPRRNQDANEREYPLTTHACSGSSRRDISELLELKARNNYGVPRLVGLQKARPDKALESSGSSLGKIYIYWPPLLPSG